MFVGKLRDLAVDAGAYNTEIYKKGRGIVLKEASVVALERGGLSPVAFGEEARKLLLNDLPDIEAIRPLLDPGEKEYLIYQKMIEYFIDKCLGGKSVKKPGLYIALDGIKKTSIYMKRINDNLAVRNLHIVDGLIAAAYGMGLDVNDDNAYIVADIGAGKTDIGIIKNSTVIDRRYISVGGHEFNKHIISYLRKKYKIFIGDLEAENIKFKVSKMIATEDYGTIEIKGRNLINAVSISINVSAMEIMLELIKPVSIIVENLNDIIEKNRDIEEEIRRKPLFLTGGASLLFGLDKYIVEKMDMSVEIAKNPFTSVVEGLAHIMYTGDGI